jgi:hypothetical protein
MMANDSMTRRSVFDFISFFRFLDGLETQQSLVTCSIVSLPEKDSETPDFDVGEW